MKFKILICLLLCIGNKCLSQEREYIVTKDDDTIYGKLIRGFDYFDTSTKRFKLKDSTGKKRLINPAEIKLMRSLKGVDGDCTITTIYDEFFIKKIIDGRINVYQLIDSAIFFTSKDGREIKEASFGGLESRKKSHFEIRVLILDNPEILEEFDLLVGSQKNILYIIEKYNSYY